MALAALMTFPAGTDAEEPADGGAIDLHAHIVTEEYAALTARHGATCEEGFPLPQWTAEGHLQFMDEAGIACAVLSMPAPQPFYGDVQECARCVRSVNEESARLKEAFPGRFRFCAALPLPDVKAALREAVYALDTLGADGVKLASNSRGLYLGDPRLDTLMAVLNERNAVVIIHPHVPTPPSLPQLTSATPVPVYEYPAETTRAVTNMLARNVLTRFPRLKVVVPHCGSFLPLSIPRMKALVPALVQGGFMQQPVDWEGNLARLYYDLAGCPTKEVIGALLTITTPDHILYGSDYPYLPPEVLKANLQRLRSLLASDAELAQYADLFLRENALRLFE